MGPYETNEIQEGRRLDQSQICEQTGRKTQASPMEKNLEVLVDEKLIMS